MVKQIEIPDGYEIDQLTFKKIEKKLPKTWEELGKIEGFYTNQYSEIEYSDFAKTKKENKNIFPTKELAEASLALAQLLQLRDFYNDGWVADWSDGNYKFIIEVYNNELNKDSYFQSNIIMNFKTAKLRDEFFENFKDLLTIAKPLL
jgi:hypothetical protein